MKFKKRVREFLENLEPHHYFNVVEFSIFLVGVFLGVTQNKIFIIISIGYVILIYIIKTLFEIKNELAMDLKFEKNKISSIFIKKNQSTILFSPYVKKNQDVYEIVLNISSMDKINKPKLRVEYSSSVSCENIITSSFLEDAGKDVGHRTRIEYTSFEYHDEEELCIVNVQPRQKQDGKYFQFEFVVPRVNFGKMSFLLFDGMGRHLSNIDLNLE